MTCRYLTQNMNIDLRPETYQPSMNEDGGYIDSMPNFKNITNGVICPCSTSEKVFLSRISFSTHMKSKRHTKWLSEINNNRRNYVVENANLKETVKYQRIIIANYEKEIRDLKQRMSKSLYDIDNTINLLDIDEIDD